MPASINDWGGSSPDTLNNPPLGGPDGWAAAVAKVANEDDTTVNDRIAAAVDAHESAPDPHPAYATDADVAAVAATVPAAIADHEAKTDPHPEYLKPSEIVAGANITVTENAGVVTIAGQAGGGGGGGGGGVLASTIYNPTTQQVPASESTALAAVDSDNLSVTFEAPASGSVYVHMQCSVYLGTALPNRLRTAMDWGLIDESGAVVPWSTKRIAASGEGVYEYEGTPAYIAHFSGLTPGQTYTWRFAFARAMGDGPCICVVGPAPRDQAMMLVQGA